MLQFVPGRIPGISQVIGDLSSINAEHPLPSLCRQVKYGQWTFLRRPDQRQFHEKVKAVYSAHDDAVFHLRQVVHHQLDYCSNPHDGL